MYTRTKLWRAKNDLLYKVILSFLHNAQQGLIAEHEVVYQTSSSDTLLLPSLHQKFHRISIGAIIKKYSEVLWSWIKDKLWLIKERVIRVLEVRWTNEDTFVLLFFFKRKIWLVVCSQCNQYEYCLLRFLILRRGTIL